jgi:hypothetical protein
MNAVSDNLWSDVELYTYLKMRADELNMMARCTKVTSYTNGVSGTQAYDFPDDLMELIEIRYDGRKLQTLKSREKDTIVPDNTISTTGTPIWYEEFDDSVTIYATPTSNSTNGIRWRYYATEDVPTAASTLKTPGRYHWGLVTGVVFSMCPKDLGHPLTVYWQGQWESVKTQITAHVRRSRRGDSFGHVTAEEDSLTTDFGTI